MVHFRKVNRRTRTNNRKKYSKKRRVTNILYSNANGIAGKTDSLKVALKANEIHIALIAETKLEGLNPYIPDYKWILKNRKNQKGGGIAILYRENMQNSIKPLEEFDETETEIL